MPTGQWLAGVGGGREGRERVGGGGGGQKGKKENRMEIHDRGAGRAEPWGLICVFSSRSRVLRRTRYVSQIIALLISTATTVMNVLL